MRPESLSKRMAGMILFSNNFNHHTNSMNMKNTQQLKTSFLFLFIFIYSFQLISAQNPTLFTVKGHVSGYGNIGVPHDVRVYVNGILNDAVITGNGNFSIITSDSNIKVELKQGTDCLNGVNVGDIIRMQNHIIGKTQLDEPNKLLAGDVNHDLKLSILDIIMIRSLILGKNDIFVNNRSWSFVDADFPINTLNWTQVNHFIQVNTSDPKVIEFKAIKLGDVDLNAHAD